MEQDSTDGYYHQALQKAAKTDEIMRFFAYKHLTLPATREMGKGFAMLALGVVEKAPRCPERTVALRKLLEGRDAALRAVQ